MAAPIQYLPRSHIADYYEIKWDDPFPPLYGKPIEIPEKTILWRGYDVAYPPISDRFAYFGSREVALGYGSGRQRSTGRFVTTKPLRVLDERFLVVLLMRLIKTNPSINYFQTFATLMLSFGLCSLGNQIRILKERFADVLKTNTAESKIIKDGIKELEKYYNPDDIIEQQGFRIAETINDGYSMTFLQEFFDGFVDGFISPRLQSPFHIEKEEKGVINAELILFNPVKSGVQRHQSPLKNVRLININELILRHHKHIIFENKQQDLKMNFMLGGGLDTTPTFHFSGGSGKGKDDFNILLNQKNKGAIKIYNQAKKDGQQWREKVDIYEIETPGPTIPVSPFRRRFLNDYVDV
jgi:hypothetical protein